MRRLARLRALAPAERRLLIEAALAVAAVRVGLWLLPFRAMRRAGERLGSWGAGRRARGQATHSPERIAWAVAVVSQYIPRASCLTRALAAEALLARRGYPAQLRIGVAKGLGGRLEAHAWLERDGQVLIGGAIHERYTALPNI